MYFAVKHDTKIQANGHLAGADRFAVASGSLAERRFVALYGRDDRVTGVLGRRSPRELLRALVAGATPWSDFAPA